MKRVFLVLCLLFFLFSTASAELIVMPMVSGGSGGAACTEESSFTVTDNNRNIAASDGGQYTSWEFTAGDWSAITKIQLSLVEYIGHDVSGKTYTIQLYNDNGNDPGTKITNGSCTFSGSLINAWASGYVYVGCTLPAGVQLTNATQYHVGLNTGGTYDGSAYCKAEYLSTGTGWHHASGDEITWGVDYDVSSTPTCKFYSGSCSGN